MKPPFAYYGGKAGMGSLIAGLLPPHRVYIEPFFGSGAVLFAKAPALHEIVNDLDHAVVTFFRVLRERPDELEWACSLSPYARAEYEAAPLDEPGLSELEVARRFWVNVNQSFAKTAGRRTGWSVTTARTQAAPASVASRIGRFRACVERLRGVSIECCDAVKLIERMARPDAVIYVDPPYPGESRVGRTAGMSDYRCDMTDPEEHRRLAAGLHATAAAVVLSGYHCPLYDELYGDWPRVEIPVMVHSSNSRTTGRDGRIEVLWSNRVLDEGRLPFLEEVAADDG